METVRQSTYCTQERGDSVFGNWTATHLQSQEVLYYMLYHTLARFSASPFAAAAIVWGGSLPSLGTVRVGSLPSLDTVAPAPQIEGLGRSAGRPGARRHI